MAASEPEGYRGPCTAAAVRGRSQLTLAVCGKGDAHGDRSNLTDRRRVAAARVARHADARRRAARIHAPPRRPRRLSQAGTRADALKARAARAVEPEAARASARRRTRAAVADGPRR